jgi:KAP family P-loop domain/Leucine Rich repeat
MAEFRKSEFALHPPQMTILSDHPAQTTRDDFLALESRLAVVLDILRHKHTRSTITVAIYGDWGTGKTSAMHWLEAQLKVWNEQKPEKREGHPRVYPVWFDPWKYHSREEVWRGIIAEVILSLFRVGTLSRQNFRLRITEAAKKFGAFLGKGFLHALAHTELKFGVGAEATVSGEMFRDIYEEFDKVNHPEKAHLNQFEDTLHSWIKDFLEDDARIVLFIDDLDRCMPEVTLEVLEAIKLYLAISRLMFVVGLDRDVVDSVVTKHYKEQGLGEKKSAQYLSKIFQVEIQIPPSEEQMKGFFDLQIKALNSSTNGYWNENLDADYREALEQGIRELARHNPRETKRLLNSAVLRGRAAVDNPNLNKDRTEKNTPRLWTPLLFAQGVQFFLVQRIVQIRLINGAELLRTRRFLDWFEQWSKLLQKDPTFRPSIFLEPKETKEIKGSGRATIALETAQRTKVKQGQLEKEFENLKNERLIDDEGKVVEKSLLLDYEPLWALLRIPFSKDVAQSMPRLEEPKSRSSAPEPSSPDAEDLAQDSLSAFPPVLLRRIARELNKSESQINLAELQQIKVLDLGDGDITNADLMYLSKLTSLQRLGLRGTQITDEGLRHLANLTSLRSLWLAGTSKLSKQAVAKLRLELPKTQIYE